MPIDQRGAGILKRWHQLTSAVATIDNCLESQLTTVVLVHLTGYITG